MFIMCTCKYCGLIFKRPCGLAMHEKVCKNNENRKPLTKHFSGFVSYNKKRRESECLNDNPVFCKFCGKTYKNKNSCKNHERYCKENPNKIESPFVKYNKDKGCAWNKGLTKETDERVAKGANTYKERFANGEIISHWVGKKHTEETKRKIAKKSGYRKGSGYGKHGSYKGYYCDSSWELAYVIYNIEHNVKFERNLKKFPYIYNGVEKTYMPDFIVDGYYVEIKGYWTQQWESKLTQFPEKEKLIVLTEDDMKPYFDYVIEKYGVDFINLYEK